MRKHSQSKFALSSRWAIGCHTFAARIRILSPGCAHIFLPYPNHPEVSLDRPRWPADAWRPFVIGRSCGLGPEHTVHDVEWRSSHSPVLPTEVFVFYPELRSDREDC